MPRPPPSTLPETPEPIRNRPVVTKAGATDDPATEAGDLDRPLSYVTYDDLGRVTSRQIYDGDGVVVADADADGTPDKPAAGLLRASESSSYDVRNRAFRTETAFVDQGTGAIGPRQLSTDSFFDRRGNLVLEAAPGQPMMQYVTDGAGRTVRVLTLGNEKALGWADAVSTAASLVLEQRDTAYDAAGNVILETTRQRFHDAAPTAFGVLGSPSAGIGARVSFATRYYDAANRPTATGDVGTNGGVTYVRPATVPGRSDTALVTSFKMRSPYGEPGRHVATANRHRMIVEAIERGDGEAASVAMERVIHEGFDRILKKLA